MKTIDNEVLEINQVRNVMFYLKSYPMAVFNINRTTITFLGRGQETSGKFLPTIFSLEINKKGIYTGDNEITTVPPYNKNEITKRDRGYDKLNDYLNSVGLKEKK